MLVLPLVAMAGASSMALFPVLWLIRTAKIAEKGTDYSVQNTAQNALYLVVSRDAKYKTKAVIDSFVVRAGDVCAAAVDLPRHPSSGSRRRGFAVLNVVLTAIWLVVAWRVGSLYRARSGTEAPPARRGSPPHDRRLCTPRCSLPGAGPSRWRRCWRCWWRARNPGDRPGHASSSPTSRSPSSPGCTWR